MTQPHPDDPDADTAYHAPENRGAWGPQNKQTNKQKITTRQSGRPWNPAKHLRQGFPREYSQPAEAAIDYPSGAAPSWMLDRITKATLPNKLISLAHPWSTHTQHPYYIQ